MDSPTEALPAGLDARRHVSALYQAHALALLYQRSFPCRTPAVGTVAWAGPGGSAIVVIEAGPVPGTPAPSMLTAALMSPAKLTPLKISTSATVAIAF